MLRLQSLRPATRVLASATTTATPSSSRFSSHDAHAHSSTEPHETYPAETFSSPFWRNAALGSLAFALFYRVYPSELALSTSEDEPTAPTPFMTKYIAYHMPEAGLWQKRSENHLDLAKSAADDKLLFQEAERPKVRRMRYLGTFNQASPNGIPVGSQADLSNLRIKSEREDFAKIGGSEEETDEEE